MQVFIKSFKNIAIADVPEVGGKNVGYKDRALRTGPSDFPEYARFLVEAGIDSISFNADALLKVIENICKAELINSEKIPI